ncbi:MAG: YgaP-like transmembrane domain [Candidatus Gracilibacteria bacterium]
MIGLINFIKKRPSDKTILLSRIVFGLILSGSLYYNLIFLNKGLDTNFFWIDVSESTVLYIKYFFISLGFVPIIVGITNVCLFKSLKIRILQIVYGILLFYISSKIQESPNLDIDVLIGFMGLFPLFAGITGKCITKKCLNYGYKIEKIRV